MCQNWNMCWDIAISIQIMGMMANSGLVRFVSWLPCAYNVSLFLNITCPWVVVIGHIFWLSPTWALPIQKHKLNDIMDPYVWRSQGIWGDRFYTYSLKSEGSKLGNGPECWSTKLPRQLPFNRLSLAFLWSCPKSVAGVKTSIMHSIPTIVVALCHFQLQLKSSHSLMLGGPFKRFT
jgi:hypothetical protein